MDCMVQDIAWDFLLSTEHQNTGHKNPIRGNAHKWEENYFLHLPNCFLHLIKNIKLHFGKIFLKYKILHSRKAFVILFLEWMKQNWRWRKQLNCHVSDSNSTSDRKWKIKGYCYLHLKNCFLYLFRIFFSPSELII